MKKQSFFMSNEKGFYLPYVLFIITIFFIVITANINTYHNEIQMTKNHLEQLIIETLIQMGYAKFAEDVPTYDKKSDTYSYFFPDGTVSITYTVFETKVNLYFLVHTYNNSVYSILKTIDIP